jgi:NAD(P)-dependent dehydrogenase (short-subunit alcohol dehydrogenase family)
MITNGKVEGQTMGTSSLSSSGNLICFITGTSQGFGFELVRAALQRGDSVVAAEAIVQAVTSENPPLHLLIGALAYQRAAAKIESLQKNFETWREVALQLTSRAEP